MSRTIEISRENWASYLNEISRLAKSRPIRLETIDRELGAQEMANQLPLIGFDLETKGSAAGIIDISVTAGGTRGELDHRIERPARMYMKLSDGGQLECLEIEDEAGAKTLAFFDQLLELPAHLAGAEAQPSP